MFKDLRVSVKYYEKYLLYHHNVMMYAVIVVVMMMITLIDKVAYACSSLNNAKIPKHVSIRSQEFCSVLLDPGYTLEQNLTFW